MSFRLVQSGDSQSGSDDVFLPNSQSSQSSSDDDYINNYVPNCIAAPPTPDYINTADEEYYNIDMSAFRDCIGAAPQRRWTQSGSDDVFLPNSQSSQSSSDDDYINNYVPNCIAAPPTPNYINAADEEYDNIDMSAFGACIGAAPQRGGLASNNSDAVPGNAGMLLESIHDYGNWQRRYDRGPEDETPFDWRDLPAPMTRYHNRTEFYNRWNLKDHPHRRLFEDFYEERPEIYAEDTDVYDTIPPFTGHMRQGLRPGSDGSIQWEGDSEQMTSL